MVDLYLVILDALESNAKWQVLDERLDRGRKALTFHLSIPEKELVCPICSKRATLVRTEMVEEQHESFFNYKVFIIADIPTVCCSAHGKCELKFSWKKSSGVTNVTQINKAKRSDAPFWREMIFISMQSKPVLHARLHLIIRKIVNLVSMAKDILNSDEPVYGCIPGEHGTTLACFTSTGKKILEGFGAAFLEEVKEIFPAHELHPFIDEMFRCFLLPVSDLGIDSYGISIVHRDKNQENAADTCEPRRDCAELNKLIFKFRAKRADLEKKEKYWLRSVNKQKTSLADFNDQMLYAFPEMLVVEVIIGGKNSGGYIPYPQATKYYKDLFNEFFRRLRLCKYYNCVIVGYRSKITYTSLSGPLLHLFLYLQTSYGDQTAEIQDTLLTIWKHVVHDSSFGYLFAYKIEPAIVMLSKHKLSYKDPKRHAISRELKRLVGADYYFRIRPSLFGHVYGGTRLRSSKSDL
jgi:hypothetical protein